jgi:hypothetical protein
VDSEEIVTDRNSVMSTQTDGLMTRNFIEHVQDPFTILQ